MRRQCRTNHQSPLLRKQYHLLLATLTALCSCVASSSAATQCTHFRAAGCHFTIRRNTPVLFPTCLSKCNFEVKTTLQCPFHSSGVFVRGDADTDGACEDEFMDVSPSPRRLPDCSNHCCTLQHSTGVFLGGAFGSRPGAMVYQPSSGGPCSMHQYTRDEVLTALQGGSGEGQHPGMDILVLGDSLMRQLYSRLIHMLRGQQRIFDYKMHTHAAYSVCKEADAFRTAPYNSNRTAMLARVDDSYLADVVPTFFASANNVEPGLLCKQPAVSINYAQAPQWEDQEAVLARYWPNAATPGRLPVVILSVAFWEKDDRVPDSYLKMLTDLALKVERIIFVGIPTKRISNDDWAAAYNARNAIMKDWARTVGAKVEFLDFDALSHLSGGPPAGADGNWHYSCYLQWPSWRNWKLESLPGNYFRDRLYSHPIEGVVMTEDGECSDEMNRNLWQMIFNVLLGDRGVPAKPPRSMTAA